jgi:hypothetical protein
LTAFATQNTTDLGKEQLHAPRGRDRLARAKYLVLAANGQPLSNPERMMADRMKGFPPSLPRKAR